MHAIPRILLHIIRQILLGHQLSARLISQLLHEVTGDLELAREPVPQATVEPAQEPLDFLWGPDVPLGLRITEGNLIGEAGDSSCNFGYGCVLAQRRVVRCTQGNDGSYHLGVVNVDAGDDRTAPVVAKKDHSRDREVREQGDHVVTGRLPAILHHGGGRSHHRHVLAQCVSSQLFFFFFFSLSLSLPPRERRTNGLAVSDHVRHDNSEAHFQQARDDVTPRI